jgi:putative heme iron utilization protein
MKAAPQDIAEARSLLAYKDHGVLSTISARLEGFPFGSVVPYSLDEKGHPIVLISTIAQHTQNVERDSKAALTVLQDGGSDVQIEARLTLIGHLKRMPADPEAQEKYYRYYKQARTYHEVHDFHFYRLESVAVRYIGGFGKIFWIEPEDFFLANPFWGKAEQGILQHMNEDHRKNLVQYFQYYKNVEVGPEDNLQMVGIDAEGFDVLWNEKKMRFDFEKPIRTPDEARQALIAMAVASAGPADATKK